jgi:hypothetical protein
MRVPHLALPLLALASAALVAGCSREREAEVKTGYAEVEVSTDLPPSQVSNEQLQSAAEGAAAIAETPGAGSSVVVSPTPTAPTAGSAPTDGQPVNPPAAQ